MSDDRKPGLYIIFDGPPGHTPGRFAEVEDETGASVGMGDREWAPLPSRYESGWGPKLWQLGPFNRSVPRRARRDWQLAAIILLVFVAVFVIPTVMGWHG